MKIIARNIRFSFKFIKLFFVDKIMVSNLLCDESVAKSAGKLNGVIIELGADIKNNYRKYAVNCQKYYLSNIKREQKILYIDIMNMCLKNNGVDNFISVAMLEHLSNPFAAITEIRRALKKNGKLLLVVPWQYPFHSAPDDYIRFSLSALKSMLKDFNIIEVEMIGNYWSALALFLQHKSNKSGINFFFYFPLYFLSFIIYWLSSLKSKSDNDPILISVLAEKNE